MAKREEIQSGLEMLLCLKPRIKMSEISADISAIFRVSGANEAIFETLSRLLEKSQKIGKYRRNIGEISESGRYFGRNFDTWKTRAWETFFDIFWEIYRRYIENIGDISAIFSIYRSIYRPAACVAEICCAEIRRPRSSLLFKRLV